MQRMLRGYGGANHTGLFACGGHLLRQPICRKRTTHPSTPDWRIAMQPMHVAESYEPNGQAMRSAQEIALSYPEGPTDQDQCDGTDTYKAKESSCLQLEEERETGQRSGLWIDLSPSSVTALTLTR